MWYIRTRNLGILIFAAFALVLGYIMIVPFAVFAAILYILATLISLITVPIVEALHWLHDLWAEAWINFNYPE